MAAFARQVVVARAPEVVASAGAASVVEAVEEVRAREPMGWAAVAVVKEANVAQAAALVRLGVVERGCRLAGEMALVVVGAVVAAYLAQGEEAVTVQVTAVGMVPVAMIGHRDLQN